MSSFQNLTESFRKNLSNIPGWSTKLKLIVFLVDDWGSIRIPNKTTHKALLEAGVDCESNRFNKYDTLASTDDLSLLFETLDSFKDKNGNPPSFTALTVVANPDFEKIRISNYRGYFYEPFTLTFKRYYGTDKVINLWREGIDAGIFIPQFHGREHLNVDLWLRGLQNNDHNLLTAFNHMAIGVPMSRPSKFRSSYMAAFDFENESEHDKFNEICHEGLALFYKTFGYQATLFTSSSLLHNHKLESYLAENGIRFIDRAKSSTEPVGGGLYRKRYYQLGQKNDSGQFYITRNCMFEPDQYDDMTSVDQALHDIEISFRWKKPAIISSHRINFVGGISMANRGHGLKCLKSLLSKIKTKWPDVEFLNFNNFADEICKANMNSL